MREFDKRNKNSYTVNMKKKLTLLMIALVFCTTLLSAATYYDAGSQIFMIKAGAEIPFTNSYKDNGSYKHTMFFGDDGTHFRVGGYGSIDYEVFTTPQTAIGGEIGYMFNTCYDGKVFTQVPMMMKFSYVPVQGRFEIPLSVGVGFNYMSYDNLSKFCLTAEATFGARIFINDNWGFGLQSGIQATPEIYLTNPDKNGFASFIPVEITATYRH